MKFSDSYYHMRHRVQVGAEGLALAFDDNDYLKRIVVVNVEGEKKAEASAPAFSGKDGEL